MKICLGVTGSIAAYRSPDMVKELMARGHEVKVILTESARELVSERVLATMSGHPIQSQNPFADDHEATDHISMARWADCFLIYAASANFMARYAAGLGDDFLSLQLLATECPVYVAPAMNPSMWKHASVQTNYSLLKTRGVQFIDPIAGVVACGESGIGHIADLKVIADALEITPRTKSETPASSAHAIAGKHILISAGPMRTSLDPVRYVQNRSSGKMGLEIAKLAKKLGAKVSVLLGPVENSIADQYSEFKPARYSTPDQYEIELERLFKSCDAFLSLAAVLDFELISETKKIERDRLSQSNSLTLPLKSVKDFVASVAQKKLPHQRVIAFAAESGTNEQILERARKKMLKKSVDLLIANPVREGYGPEADQNEIWILSPKQNQPLYSAKDYKSKLAAPILDAIQL